MQPFNPPKHCPKCRTELVKDMYDQTVHAETAQTQCPIRFTQANISGWTNQGVATVSLQKCSRCRALVEKADEQEHANYHRETGSM